jgi:hypothetical protein
MRAKSPSKRSRTFEPTLTVDGKRQRGIAFLGAIARLGCRQVQPNAQICAVVKPAHLRGAHTGHGRLRHERRTIAAAMIAHMEVGLAMAGQDREPDSHGTFPSHCYRTCACATYHRATGVNFSQGSLSSPSGCAPTSHQQWPAMG